MDPNIVAALISGGSQLVGGALGRREHGKTTAAEMRAKINTGKEFGLHPLASIGAQTSGYTGSYIGDAVAGAGAAAAEGISRSAGAKRQKTLDNRDNQLLDAQIEEARSRTLLNHAQARSMASAAPDPYAPRKENALVQVKLENGDVVYVPNPDIYEISPTELATGRSIIEGARLVQKSEPGTPSFPKNPPLGMVIPDPDPRYEWQYNKSGWRQRKRRKLK